MDLQYERMESRDNTLSGGGEMGRLMREQDWAATHLGDVSRWPQSLRTTVSICLASRFPIIIFWGPELRQFYNDAYRPILGMSKHPRALGQRAEECWPEIWDVVGPMLHSVLTTGDATWSENQLLFLDRNGYVEETYFTFSYSPIRDESGEVSGVFCAVTETTNEVLGARRLATLRALAADTAEEHSAEAVCRVAVSTLACNSADLPFTQLYLLDSTGSTARLVSQAGLVGEVVPTTVDLADPDAAWPFAQVIESGLVDLLACSGEFVTLNSPSPTSALVLPITRAGEAYGFLIAGLNPRHDLDDDYRGFLSLVAGQVATAISSARTLQDARERADALAELDRAKTTFFSNVSHEFRTPLTLLLGPLETLLADEREPLTASQRAQIEMVRRNGLRQLKLVNTLLDFSRIEAGRVEALYEPTDLARLTIDLTSAFRATIEQAGLRLLVEVSQLAEAVYVDQEMWEKIVLNLLSNAFKFTLQGEIRVQLRADDENVLLSVADTGVGIDAQELPHLFERFYRAHSTQARTYEGSGIGLALVQELVHMHGGRIDVTSRLGLGTTFVVSIPRGSAHLPADRLGSSRVLSSSSVAAELYVEEALRWLPEMVQAYEDEESPSDAARLSVPLSPLVPPSSATRILIVDDNADMRDHLRRLLGPVYTVRTVSDGEAALQTARTWLPDLILTDVMMPRLTGFELLAALHADVCTRFIPVIVLSARAGEEAIVEGLRAGAVDYLVKPFSAREVLARVQAQLEIARLQRESMNRVSTLEAIFETITDSLFIVDQDKNVYDMNRAARVLLKLPADSSGMAQKYYDLFDLYDVQGRLLSQDEWPQSAILNGATLQGASAVDVMMRTYDGRTLFLSVTGAPVYKDTGELGGAVLVCRDVTERRGMEEALRQSEELFRTAFTSARVGISLTDLQLRFLQINAAYCAITGYSEEELLQTNFISITHPDDREDNMASIQKVLAGEAPGFVLQKRYIRKDGSFVWVQNSVSLIYDSEGRPHSLIAVTEDITERREWAQRTQEALETLLAMAEVLVSVPDVSESSDPLAADIYDAHKEIHHLVQLTCDLLGCKIANISTVEPETLRFSPFVKVGVTAELEREWRDQTPQTFLSDYLSSDGIDRLMAGEALLVDIAHPITPGTPTYGTRQVLTAPLRIGEQLVGLLSTNYDTSVHKYSLQEEKVLLRAIGKLIALMIERERLVQERADGLARELTLREVNRQTDEFISIISHELKSPLTTIKGNVQLARRQMTRLLAQGIDLPLEVADPFALVLRFLERAERHVLVQTRLINDLLDVSRIHSNRLELHIERHDLVLIVREAVEDQHQLAASRVIHLSIEEPEAIILADADRVGQVLNNYLSNALKYSDESKPVEVWLSREGSAVKVAIVDQGPGLSPEQQEHIWERFYRVPDIEVKSGSGVGLGLGLHICRTIIERQGGEVGVESKPGQGSTFWFTLPLADIA